MPPEAGRSAPQYSLWLNQALCAGARWCPEEEASWFSRLTFAYVEGLLRKGKIKALVMDDLWDVAESDVAPKVAARFQVCSAEVPEQGIQLEPACALLECDKGGVRARSRRWSGTTCGTWPSLTLLPRWPPGSRCGLLLQGGRSWGHGSQRQRESILAVEGLLCKGKIKGIEGTA